MAGDLARLLGGGEQKESKALQNARRQVYEEAVIAGEIVDSAAVVTARMMTRVADVDHLRRQLAGGDQILNMALVEIQLGFITRMTKLQRDL